MKKITRLLLSLSLISSISSIHTMWPDELAILSKHFARNPIMKKIFYQCVAGNENKCNALRSNLRNYHENEMREVLQLQNLVGDKGITSVTQAEEIDKILKKSRFYEIHDASWDYSTKVQCSHMTSRMMGLDERNADLCGTYIKGLLESRYATIHQKESLALEKFLDQKKSESK